MLRKVSHKSGHVRAVPTSLKHTHKQHHTRSGSLDCTPQEAESGALGGVSRLASFRDRAALRACSSRSAEITKQLMLQQHSLQNH